MLQEMTMNELMKIDGGAQLTVSQLLWAMGKGAVAGALSGAIAGSVVPGGGTIAGAFAGMVFGAASGQINAIIDLHGSEMVEDFIN